MIDPYDTNIYYRVKIDTIKFEATLLNICFLSIMLNIIN